MKTTILTVALLFLGVNPVLTQEDSLFTRASRVMEAGKLSDAAQLFTQYLQSPDARENARNRANGLYKLAACFFYMSEYDSTIKYMEDALAEKEKLVAPSDTFLLSSHAVLGYVYRYERRNIRKAAAQFDAEREIIDANPTSFSQIQIYKNYYNLASANRILQDYDRALNYAYQALEVAQRMYETQPENAENCYVVIANSLSGKKQYQQADEFYRRKVAVNIEQRGAEHSSLALDYYNLALNYNDMERPGDAIIYFRKAEDIANKNNRSLLSNIYRGLGVAHRLSGNSDTSLEYLYKAVPLARPRPLRSAWNYRQIALHYEISNQFDSALYNYQKAFLALIPDFEWSDPEENPALNRLVSGNPYVYKLLELKANCYLKAFYSSHDKEALLAAKDSYDLLDELTDKYRDNLVLESSRLFFQQRNHAVYQKAIEVNFELHQLSAQIEYVENAWMLIEKNKSILLLENLLSAERQVGLKLPDSIRNVGRLISETLLKAQKDISICESSGDCSESRLIALRDTISTNEDLFRKHQTEVKKDFSDYYNFASNEGVTDLATLKNTLERNQLFINYFESDDHFYFISISHDEVKLNRTPKSDSLTQTLSVFLKESSGETLQTNGITNSFHRFTNSAYELFKTLIPDVLVTSPYQKLIVIPDGQLAGIPFDALIQKLPEFNDANFSKLDYLVKDYSINYGFSATLWYKNITGQKNSVNNEIVAFGATETPDRPELARLNAVQAEIQNLEKLENARVFANEEATEENFKKEIRQADIIHLALHNVNDYANPLNSQLIFSTDKQSEDSGLFLYEIFNTEMTPSLVVLSSCETGVGKWLQGEGAYHMGRGFLYHGNPALVISLWKARDITTATIMKDFYGALRKDKNSSESIRSAKLSYLNSADPLTAHPSNWAAFISIGQSNIDDDPKLFKLFWLLPVLLLIVLIAKKVVWKKHNSQTT